MPDSTKREVRARMKYVVVRCSTKVPEGHEIRRPKDRLTVCLLGPVYSYFAAQLVYQLWANNIAIRYNQYDS